MQEEPMDEDIREAIADFFLNLNNHLKSHSSGTSGNKTEDCITLNGTNAGAQMIIKASNSDETRNFHCINIYVNNNVQGVNNSILVGSEVRMGDPGIHSYLPSLRNREEKGSGGKISKDERGHGSMLNMNKKVVEMASWSAPFFGINSFYAVILLLLLLFLLLLFFISS